MNEQATKRAPKVRDDYIREHEIALLKLLVSKYPRTATEEIRKLVLDKRK